MVATAATVSVRVCVKSRERTQLGLRSSAHTSMPKRGIHPFLNRLTYVLRNGASVELPSVMQSSKPILLQSVRRRAQAV